MNYTGWDILGVGVLVLFKSEHFEPPYDHQSWLFSNSYDLVVYIFQSQWLLGAYYTYYIYLSQLLLLCHYIISPLQQMRRTLLHRL